jgi:hypothetical protein
MVCMSLCHETASSLSYNKDSGSIEWNNYYQQTIDEYLLEILKEFKYEFVCSSEREDR